MESASILHATALAKTYAPKRKIKLIRSEVQGRNLNETLEINKECIQQNVSKPKRRIMLTREPFKEKVLKREEKGPTMPPRKKKDSLPPIEEKVIMVHVAVLEKKMAILPVEDVETVRLVLHDHAGKSYYRDTAKNKLFHRTGPKAIGSYVGRWDPIENSIRTDISDSDAEM